MIRTLSLLWLLTLLPSPVPGQTYPAARRDTVMDLYHGVRVADPYRWLENLTAAETEAFVAEQNRLTSNFLESAGAERARIRERLTELTAIRPVPLPTHSGGHVFYRERVEGKRLPLLYMRGSEGDSARMVLDYNEVTPDGSLRLRHFAPSPAGRYLGYNRSKIGTDTHQELAVRDLASGRDVPELVPGGWWMIWTQDEQGFFYPRDYHAADARLRGTRLYYHRVGTAPETDRLVYAWPESAGSWLTAHGSDDGRYLVVEVNGTAGSPNQLYALDLRDARSPDLEAPAVWRLDEGPAVNSVIGVLRDTLYLLTTLDAPMRRVMRRALDTGPHSAWETVVAETDDPIQGALIAGGQLLINYSVDVKSDLRRFTLDGVPLGQVRGAGVGTVWLDVPLANRQPHSELVYEYVSMVTPRRGFRYDFEMDVSIPLHPQDLPYDPGRYETRQVFFHSRDGTRVPMFITAAKGLVLDGSHPVMLEGYGGYGAGMSPFFRPENILWLELGGVIALANIRGGDEYGEEWHRGGMRENKQNSFDDFIAAAEYLVREGYTSPARLGIIGYSNGGLLMGAVLTQRPELFGAAFPQAGHHDMLRYHRLPGARWTSEFGTADDPEQFRYLYAYSPLHNVRTGVCYPATLILAREEDAVVVPSHSYKFAAALQAAQGCENPILLRVASGGHGSAVPAGTIDQLTDLYTFAAVRLGAVGRSAGPGSR